MSIKFIKYLIIFIVFTIVGNSYSQCGIQDTINIPDDEKPLELKFNISNILNNDLSDPNQGVCGVSLNYKHQQRMDLTIDLYSPAGQHVTLVGPRDPFNKPLTGYIHWDISFTTCLDIASPDSGKSDVFDNSNPTWGFGSTYNGVYYPNSGCLEDFNTGPVNGWWTLAVWDHDKIFKGEFYGFTITFCDGSTYDCDFCDANAGSFLLQNIVVCAEDPYPDIEITPQYEDTVFVDPVLYGYTYILHQNDSLIEISENPDVANLTQGNYQICGMSYLRQDSVDIFTLAQTLAITDFIDSIESIGSPYCADIMDNCIDLEIRPVNNLINIDTTICSYDTLKIVGFYFSDSGDYYLETSLNKCDTAYLIHLQVDEVNAGIVASDTLLDCANNDTLKLTGTGFYNGIGMNFGWNKNLIPIQGDTTSVFVGQPGKYKFFLSLGNCTDTAEITISSTQDFPVLSYDLQNINCKHDSATISVFSQNTSIDSVIWRNSQGFYSNAQILNTADPGEYEVSVYSPGGCRAFDIVNVEADTVKPVFTINATDITCGSDTAYLSIVSNDDIESISWSNLGIISKKDTFTLKPGMYYVTVSSSNGCESYDSIYVDEIDSPIDYSIYYDTLNCVDTSVMLGVNAISGQIDSVFWLNPLNDTIFNREFETDIPGAYYLFFEDNNGCYVNDTIEIIEDANPPQLTIDIPVLYLSCGIDSVRLSFNTSSSIDSVFWTGPGGFQSNDFSPFAHYAGIYSVSIFGENGCQANGDISVVPDNTVADIDFTSDTIDCLKDTAILKAIYTGNYQLSWEDSLGNVFSGDSLITDIGGYYKITVTDLNNNCSNQFFAYVPVDTIHPNLQIIKEGDINCINKNIQLSINSDVELKQVFWTGDGYMGSGDTTLIDHPGIYKARAISTGYCESIDSIEVFTTDSFDISPDTMYLNCYNGGKVELRLKNVSDSFSFHWTGPNLDTFGISPVVNKAGKYNVIVSAGECIDSSFVLVLEDFEPPDLDVDFNPVIGCAPGYSVLRASLDTTSVDTFFWQGPGFASSQLIDTIYNAGQYEFRAIGKNGCESLYLMNIVLSNDYTDVEAIGDTVNCITGLHDLKIRADISGQYDSLVWHGPNGFVSNSPESVVTQSGIYYLDVINALGCISSDSVSVVYDISPPVYEISNPDIITCYNDSALLSVNTDTSKYHFYWNGPYGFESDSLQFYIKRGGEYYFKITGNNGCYSEDTVNVNIDKLKPYVFLDADNLNCKDFVSEIKINSNVDNFSFIVRGPDGYSVFDEMPRVNIPGVYSVELTDLDNGCTSFDSITINKDTILPDIIVDDYYLNCDSSLIKMRARSSFPNIEYYWNGPDTIFVHGDVCYTNTPGTYIVFAVGENKCAASDTIMVYDIPIMPEFEAFTDNINCLKDSAQLLAIGVEDDYSFEWTGPNGFYSKEKSPVVSMQGDYFLHVVGKNKCDSVAQVSVSVDTIKPQISISYQDSIICEKQNGILSTEIINKNDSVYIFNWDTKDGKILNGSHSGKLYFKGEGMYTVDVVSVKNGCIARDSFLVKEAGYSLDSALIKVIAPTCFGYNDGGFIIDSVIGGISPYIFSIDNYWFSNSNEFNSKSSGEYDVYVKDANGCRLDTTIIVPNGADVQLQLISDKATIFPGETVNLKGLVLSDDTINKIVWNPGDYFPFMDTLNQHISPDESIDISLKVFDINNCWDEDNLRIYVKNNPEIYIPDIFTPDYDNINDYFFVKAGKGIKSIKKFMIFDRWGEKVFEKNDMRLNVPIEGWDGKFKNREAMEGVYVYYIEVELENGKIIKYSGDITLIR